MRRLAVATLATVALAGCGTTSSTSSEHEHAQDEQIAAIIDCLRNNAYDRTLLGQCIDDWYDSNATSDY